MAFTSSLGTSASGLSNIELGIGATPFVVTPTVPAIFIGGVQNRFTPNFKAVHRATPQILTNPGIADVATNETFPYAVDVSNYMGFGDTITNVTGTMTEVATSRPVASSVYGSSSVSGNVITIPINCSKFRIGVPYQSIVTFTANTNKIISYSTIFNPVGGSATIVTTGNVGLLGPANQLMTKPGLFTTASTETAWPYMIDVSNYLTTNDTISNVSANVFFANTGTLVTAAWQVGALIVSGNVIIFYINISKFTIGQTFQIMVNFTANTNKVCSYISEIQLLA